MMTSTPSIRQDKSDRCQVCRPRTEQLACLDPGPQLSGGPALTGGLLFVSDSISAVLLRMLRTLTLHGNPPPLAAARAPGRQGHCSHRPWLRRRGMQACRACSTVIAELRASLTWYTLCHHLPVTNSRLPLSSHAMPAHEIVLLLTGAPVVLSNGIFPACAKAQHQWCGLVLPPPDERLSGRLCFAQ